MGIQRTVKILGRLSVIALLAGLAGCLQTPALLVTPAALNIGTGQQNANFRIANPGAGTLEWTVTEDIPWLMLRHAGSEAADTVSGSTAGAEIDVIEIVADREGLPIGASTGVLTVTSNGGTQTINVSIVETRPAELFLSNSDLNFDVSGTEQILFVSNIGVDALNWSATVSADAPWLSITPAEGTLDTVGDFETVNFNVDREGLAANTFTGTVTFTSNGGTEVVDVTMIVPPYSANPDSIQFGTISSPSSSGITISSNSFSGVDVVISANTDDGAGWLSLGTTSGTVPASGSLQTTVTADPAGLAPGDYTGEVRITNPLDGFTLTVPVSMSINRLLVSPALIDFADNFAIDQDTITIQNLDSSNIDFTINVPASATWLSVTGTTSTVVTTVQLTVEIDRSAVGPGRFETDVVIGYAGGSATVRVAMTNPKPAELKVEPRVIDLAATRNSELIGVWNDGIGTVDYRIDSSAFPVWLTIEPAGAGGISTGSLTGAATDAFTLRVNRALAPLGQTSFEHTFTVEASGDATNDVDVTVKMLSPLIPRIAVVADGVDSNGDDFLSFDTDEGTRTFIIRNEGTGSLQWSIDTSSLPSWITSVDPATSSIESGKQRTVTIAVNRAGLNFQGAQGTLQITSNDPAQPTRPLIVEVLVEKLISIGTSPTTISFGLNGISDLLDVANFGDPDTVLDYKITTSKEWLAVFPDTGSSIGTASPFKDFKTHSVTVDRALLGGQGGSALITIRAFTIEDGEPVPIDTIAPATVAVSVEAAKLTIETARPRLRIPSLVRFVLLLRNIQFEALPIPDTRLDEIAALTEVAENEIPLETDETSTFMQPIERARTNVLILLDYSGSMQESARRVSDPAISTAPDPIQALYERTISQLITELPANYKIGLAVFNDRAGGAYRAIKGNALEADATRDEVFLRDKALLLERLTEIVVTDNGATSLGPAVESAVAQIIAEDRSELNIPFDDADVRALITITDGRLTTPPGVFNDIAEPLVLSSTRFMCIGWGRNVNADLLVRLATESGGHFYNTATEDTGSEDAFGNPIRIPLVSELEDWVTTDLVDECDQSLAKDFDAQVIFSYVTLNESAGVTVEGTLSFNDPNDQNSECLTEQGEITGTFEKSQLDFESISGDPRLGQISLSSEGVQPDGTAEILMRLEGSPRNVSRFSFNLNVENAAALQRGNVTAVASPEGGVISDWTQSGAGSIFTYVTPDDPLRYGEFGDLLRIRVTGILGGEFTLNLNVLEPVIDFGNPNSKYITYPDSITLDDMPFVATAFPKPFLNGVPEPVKDENGLFTFNLGEDIDTFLFFLFNYGGAHEPTKVWLEWDLMFGLNGELLSLIPSNASTEGTLIYTDEVDTLNFAVDRSVLPGDYETEFNFTYRFGTVNVELEQDPIRVLYTVTEPDLVVSQNVVNFGLNGNDLQLNVTNAGQSILQWEVNNIFDFPAWLSITQTSDVLRMDQSSNVRLRVDRGLLPPGNTSFDIDIVEILNSETGQIGDAETVTVNVTAP